MLDFFKGSASQTETGSFPNGEQSSIFSMLSVLTELRDEQWVEYAFLREILRDRLNSKQKRELMRQAVACGETAADRLLENCPGATANQLADFLGIKVQKTRTSPGAVNQNLLAVYQEPDEITVYMNGVEEATQLFRQEKCPGLIRDADAYGIVLAHELFHVLEYRDRDKLWCCSYQIQLWKLGPLRYRTGLSVLAEISAMAFAKRVNRLPCLPYFVEVAVLYGKSPADSSALFQMMTDRRNTGDDCPLKIPGGQ